MTEVIQLAGSQGKCEAVLMALQKVQLTDTGVLEFQSASAVPVGGMVVIRQSLSVKDAVPLVPVEVDGPVTHLVQVPGSIPRLPSSRHLIYR